jgi:Tfp pilus assembly protein PilV
MIRRQDRRGFALPAAIGALVIVGVLVTAGFYVARQELRIGAASRFSAMALDLAQSDINNVLINRTSAFVALPVWGDTTMVDTASTGVVSVKVTKLATRLFFVDATATVTEGGAMWSGATRRIGVVTRVSTADINPRAGLTTQGALKYGGSSEIHGMDEIPDGSSGGSANWAGICDTTGMTNKPGILTNDTSAINWNGNRSKIEDNMTGTPLFTQDTTITPTNLMTFGDMNWSDMVALADKVYSGSPGSIGPVVTNGVCNTSVQDNWGAPTDPTSPCFNYFPIIYFSGDLQLSGGIGQGILLVNGDLKVTGGAEFYGPVFVRGTLTTMGSGGHFWGGVVAANADLGTTTVLGNAVITYSSCATSRALLNNSALTRIRPLTERSWVDLSSVMD